MKIHTKQLLQTNHNISILVLDFHFIGQHLEKQSPIKQQGTSTLLATDQTGDNRGRLSVGTVLVEAEEKDYTEAESCTGKDWNQAFELAADEALI